MVANEIDASHQLPEIQKSRIENIESNYVISYLDLHQDTYT